MPRIDEDMIFPLLGGLAILMFLVAQVLPADSRLRRITIAACGLLIVGGVCLSILFYLADLTAR